MSAFEIAQFCREKTRERAANFVRFRSSEHAKLGRWVPRALRNRHGVCAALGRVSAALGDEIVRHQRSKARKISRENARTCGKFCSISVQCACKTRPARAACAAQHARCRRSCRTSQRCVGCRDCATSAFEIAQFFARKRANVLQILFDFVAVSMRNSAGGRRVHCL